MKEAGLSLADTSVYHGQPGVAIRLYTVIGLTAQLATQMDLRLLTKVQMSPVKEWIAAENPCIPLVITKLQPNTAL